VERRFYAIEVAYEGGRYRGFQTQPGLPTVQGALRAALASLGVRAPLAVAARTDAGVHALRQVVSFAVRAALEPKALRRGLNAALPEGILVLDAHRVARSFHARNTATGRQYVYLVGTPPPKPMRPYAWCLPDPRAFPDILAPRLDASAMQDALAFAVGTHDFAGLARRGEQRGTTRTVTRADVVSAEWAPLHAIVLEGRGFLRAMVRNLVGSAVAAGLGLEPTTVIRDLIAARGRYRGVRAPGFGLTLAEVRYPPGTLPRGAPTG
jgi:tRNA pseudouridine38-40 synthase